MTTKKKIVTTTLRLPEDLHAKLAKISEEIACPFNTFVVMQLALVAKKSKWLDDARSVDDGK